MQPTVSHVLARPSTVAILGLTGGFTVGRRTGRRDVGGVLFAAAGAWCARQWARSSGPGAAAALAAAYVGGMGLSHPLAKKIGAWPAVVVAAAIVAAGSEGVTRSRV